MNIPKRKLLFGMALLGCLSLAAPGLPQGRDAKGGKVTPKLEPVAETKLIMEGLAHANFRGLDRILSQREPEPQAWTFARGQALLLAETGNLLMLRPPRNQGESVWFERAMEFRAQAAKLAQVLAKRDLEGGKAGLGRVAQSCNRCHQTFRVAVEITPFVEEGPAPRTQGVH